MLKIVIAGATGFIGQKLTSRLLDSQTSVVVLTRKPASVRTTKHARLSYGQWNGKTQGDWTEHIDGADAVVNLSGQSIASRRWSSTRKQQLYSSRIDSTNALVEAIGASRVKPSVLLNASAVGYYGHIEQGAVIEEHQPGNDFLGRLCADWESAALAARAFGVRVVLLRTGIVLDPEGGALQRMILPFKLFAGGPLGSGEQWFPWIHEEDEIRAILYTLERNSLSGPVNLSAPESTTMREFSNALGSALHRPSALRIPAFMLRFLLGEMADVVLSGQQVVPQKLMKEGFEFRFPTLPGALADLLR
ncbi:MAG: TIGR01777 family oxidoreductase [Ignavibacteria bacterium]|nr:TIGR01777 family oxidoreductase [Ignavibacteria bacterium]